MRLDRYSGQPFRFQVFRRVDDAARGEVEVNGAWYERVDPDECFVLKRRDANSMAALVGYAASAELKDPELARDVERLTTEWTRQTAQLQDRKQPD
jgi:hypothetical protein